MTVQRTGIKTESQPVNSSLSVSQTRMSTRSSPRKADTSLQQQQQHHYQGITDSDDDVTTANFCVLPLLHSHSVIRNYLHVSDVHSYQDPLFSADGKLVHTELSLMFF